MKSRNLWSVMVLAMAASTNVFAQGNKPPKPGGDTPATSTLDDSSAMFRIRSDGAGPYFNGVGGVESIIQGIGDWELDARTSPSIARSIFIDFGDPVVPGDAIAPFSSAPLPARFISKCASLGLKMVDIPLNESRTCPLALAFDHNGINYRITFNDSTLAVTDNVKWTCLATSSTKCVYWVMEPSTQYDGASKSKALLIKVGTNKRNPDQALGLFYFDFRIDVSTP